MVIYTEYEGGAAREKPKGIHLVDVYASFTNIEVSYDVSSVL